MLGFEFRVRDGWSCGYKYCIYPFVSSRIVYLVAIFCTYSSSPMGAFDHSRGVASTTQFSFSQARRPLVSIFGINIDGPPKAVAP